jgi:hypothetical protein
MKRGGINGMLLEGLLIWILVMVKTTISEGEKNSQN